MQQINTGKHYPDGESLYLYTTKHLGLSDLGETRRWCFGQCLDCEKFPSDILIEQEVKEYLGNLYVELDNINELPGATERLSSAILAIIERLNNGDLHVSG